MVHFLINAKNQTFFQYTNKSNICMSSIRAVVMLLKVRGPNLLKPFGPFLPEKVGGPKSAFTTVWPKKWGGQGPLDPLGDYGPDIVSHLKVLSNCMKGMLAKSVR